MLQDLLLAVGLLLVLEGLLPALNPRGWRSAMEQLGTLSDSAIRSTGIGMIVAGGLIFLAR
jgi:uncharacterized protein YjeT (DUF2065 family)